MGIDPVQGNNQTHTCYWNWNWNNYEENKEGLESDQSANSLYNRWCTINEKVVKFIDFDHQMFGRNQSKLSEQDEVPICLWSLMMKLHWDVIYRYASLVDRNPDNYRQLFI